jgi:hypothetical protein
VVLTKYVGDSHTFRLTNATARRQTKMSDSIDSTARRSGGQCRRQRR